MVPQWAADIAIDLDLAMTLVHTQFPTLAREAIVPFGVGWDNAAYLVGERVVFRFPRRRVARRLIEREIAILPVIAPALPLAIPVPSYIGVASDAYPHAFAGYERIAGETACARDLDNDARVALAEPLGAFLRALHAIDPAPLVARGLPHDEIRRLDHTRRMLLVREREPLLRSPESAVRTGVATATIARTIDWLEAHPPTSIADAARRCVHGDLYARHVVLDGARVAGIIDWGEVHLGNPAIDLAIAHLMLPTSAHAAFRAAYGSIDDDTWETARFRAAYHALIELDYGIREDDAGMNRIGAAALSLMGFT